MEGWAEELKKIVAGRKNSKYHKNYIATHIVEEFITRTVAKERESAERRGREKAVEYIKANAERMTLLRCTDFDVVLLEAARKDLEV